MATFLRLELTGRAGDIVMINVENIERIRPCWPKGASIVISDGPDLHVTASFDELQARLCSTGGRTQVYSVEHNDHVDEAYEAMRADPLP